MALLTHTTQVLQQMSILLRCCPSGDDEVPLQEWSPLPQNMLSPLAVSSSSDHVVRDIAQTIEVCPAFNFKRQASLGPKLRNRKILHDNFTRDQFVIGWGEGGLPYSRLIVAAMFSPSSLRFLSVQYAPPWAHFLPSPSTQSSSALTGICYASVLLFLRVYICLNSRTLQRRFNSFLKTSGLMLLYLITC